MNEIQSTHWVCQSCRAPTGRDGIIEIINVNIDLGAIGTYPRRPTEDRRVVEERFLTAKANERGVTRKDLVLTALELAEIPHVTPNNAFVVRHVKCTADREVQGYWFATSRAATLEEWIGWALHLGDKTWMGREDLLAMLRFWWTHRGAQPPAGM